MSVPKSATFVLITSTLLYVEIFSHSLSRGMARVVLDYYCLKNLDNYSAVSMPIVIVFKKTLVLFSHFGINYYQNIKIMILMKIFFTERTVRSRNHNTKQYNCKKRYRNASSHA